jgi:hypothetical protein
MRLPEKSRDLLREGAPVSEKYAFIEAEYATVARATARAPAIVQICTWLRVSRSGFYEWRRRSESAEAKRRNHLKLLIAKAFEDSEGTYGYWRIALQLAAGARRRAGAGGGVDAGARPGRPPPAVVAALHGQPATPRPASSACRVGCRADANQPLYMRPRARGSHGWMVVATRSDGLL